MYSAVIPQFRQRDSVDEALSACQDRNSSSGGHENENLSHRHELKIAQTTLVTFSRGGAVNNASPQSFDGMASFPELQGFRLVGITVRGLFPA